MLIRLQTQRNRDSEAQTMSVVVSQPVEDVAHDVAQKSMDSVQQSNQNNN